MKKIICVLMMLLCVITIFTVSASADSFTEFYEYSGTAISSTTSNILEGYAFNIMNDPVNDYDSWFAVRVGQYQYLICVFRMSEDVDFSSMPSDGTYVVYNERLYSYVDNTTRYQAGFTNVSGSVSINFTRYYMIGNCYGTIGVNMSDQASHDMKYVKYLLYTLIIFLLLWVAFKFMNKRWLLP